MYALSPFRDYADYVANASARGVTPLAPSTIEFFVNDALSKGMPESDIRRFLAENPGDWARLSTSFSGYERDVVLTSHASQQIVVSAGPGSVAPPALPPPVIQQATTTGDSRMFLTLTNVPEGTSGGAPARQLAQFASSPIGMPTTTSAMRSGSGGINWVTVILLAAIAGATWYYVID